MKKNMHLDHISPKMNKDESKSKLNHIALALATQKEDVLLLHYNLLLANPNHQICALEVNLLSSKVLLLIWHCWFDQHALPCSALDI